MIQLQTTRPNPAQGQSVSEDKYPENPRSFHPISPVIFCQIQKVGRKIFAGFLFNTARGSGTDVLFQEVARAIAIIVATKERHVS